MKHRNKLQKSTKIQPECLPYKSALLTRNSAYTGVKWLLVLIDVRLRNNNIAR